jgi:predicted Zn-dependent protease
MRRSGGDPRALATILARVTADKAEGIKILQDHPDTKDRVAAINAMAPAGATTPLLGAADWAALKQICAPQTASVSAPATSAPTSVKTIQIRPTTPGAAQRADPARAGDAGAGSGQKGEGD